MDVDGGRWRRGLSILLASTGLIAATLVTGLFAPASACTCAQMALGSLVRTGEEVFVATPVDAPTKSSGSGVASRTYRMRVSDVYKGSPGSTTTVRTPASAATCGVDMATDTQYVIVGDRTGDALHTTSCSGTRPISDRVLGVVERTLGAATPYRGLPEDGDNGNGSPDKDRNQSEPRAEQNDQRTEPGSDNDDGVSLSYLFTGALLAGALALAYLLPRLRRRRRNDSDSS